MAGRRDTYIYELKVGKKVVHMGATTDLKRREREHQKDFPHSRIVQVGHKTTREAASRWERAKLDKVRIEPKELRNVSSRARTNLSQHKGKILRVLGE